MRSAEDTYPRMAPLRPRTLRLREVESTELHEAKSTQRLHEAKSTAPLNEVESTRTSATLQVIPTRLTWMPETIIGSAMRIAMTRVFIWTVLGSTAVSPAASVAVTYGVWPAAVPAASGLTAGTGAFSPVTLVIAAIGFGIPIPSSSTKIPTTRAGISPITPVSARMCTYSI